MKTCLWLWIFVKQIRVARWWVYFRNDRTRHHTDVFQVFCCQCLIEILSDGLWQVLFRLFVDCCYRGRQFSSRWVFFVILDVLEHHMKRIYNAWNRFKKNTGDCLFGLLVFLISGSKRMIRILHLGMSKSVREESLKECRGMWRVFQEKKRNENICNISAFAKSFWLVWLPYSTVSSSPYVFSRHFKCLKMALLLWVPKSFCWYTTLSSSHVSTRLFSRKISFSLR